MEYNGDMVMEDIAMMREVYSEIDRMLPSFVDAEMRLDEAQDSKYKIENKYRGKAFVELCVLVTIVLLIPLCTLSAFGERQMFWFAPLVAAIGVWLYGSYYRKKQMPVLLKGINGIIDSAIQDRNNLINVINQSYYNIEMELNRLLRTTENDEFIDLLDTEGLPVECDNIIALDYMYTALKRGYASNFADALMHFRELKKALANRTDEESIKLLDDVTQGELQGEYRSGYIKHCRILSNATANKKESE